jgi:hypothetical protein
MPRGRLRRLWIFVRLISVPHIAPRSIDISVRYLLQGKVARMFVRLLAAWRICGPLTTVPMIFLLYHLRVKSANKKQYFSIDEISIEAGINELRILQKLTKVL